MDALNKLADSAPKNPLSISNELVISPKNEQLKKGKERLETTHPLVVPTSFVDLRNIRLKKKCNTWTENDLRCIQDVEKKRLECEE